MKTNSTNSIKQAFGLGRVIPSVSLCFWLWELWACSLFCSFDLLAFCPTSLSLYSFALFLKLMAIWICSRCKLKSLAGFAGDAVDPQQIQPGVFLASGGWQTYQGLLFYRKLWRQAYQCLPFCKKIESQTYQGLLFCKKIGGANVPGFAFL